MFKFKSILTLVCLLAVSFSPVNAVAKKPGPPIDRPGPLLPPPPPPAETQIQNTQPVLSDTVTKELLVKQSDLGGKIGNLKKVDTPIVTNKVLQLKDLKLDKQAQLNEVKTIASVAIADAVMVNNRETTVSYASCQEQGLCYNKTARSCVDCGDVDFDCTYFVASNGKNCGKFASYQNNSCNIIAGNMRCIGNIGDGSVKSFCFISNVSGADRSACLKLKGAEYDATSKLCIIKSVSEKCETDSDVAVSLDDSEVYELETEPMVSAAPGTGNSGEYQGALVNGVTDSAACSRHSGIWKQNASECRCAEHTQLKDNYCEADSGYVLIARRKTSYQPYKYGIYVIPESEFDNSAEHKIITIKTEKMDNSWDSRYGICNRKWAEYDSETGACMTPLNSTINSRGECVCDKGMGFWTAKYLVGNTYVFMGHRCDNLDSLNSLWSDYRGLHLSDTWDRNIGCYDHMSDNLQWNSGTKKCECKPGTFYAGGLRCVNRVSEVYADMMDCENIPNAEEVNGICRCSEGFLESDSGLECVPTGNPSARNESECGMQLGNWNNGLCTCGTGATWIAAHNKCECTNEMIELNNGFVSHYIKETEQHNSYRTNWVTDARGLSCFRYELAGQDVRYFDAVDLNQSECISGGCSWDEHYNMCFSRPDQSYNKNTKKCSCDSGRADGPGNICMRQNTVANDAVSCTQAFGNWYNGRCMCPYGMWDRDVRILDPYMTSTETKHVCSFGNMDGTYELVFDENRENMFYTLPSAVLGMADAYNGWVNQTPLVVKDKNSCLELKCNWNVEHNICLTPLAGRKDHRVVNDKYKPVCACKNGMSLSCNEDTGCVCVDKCPSGYFGAHGYAAAVQWSGNLCVTECPAGTHSVKDSFGPWYQCVQD